MGQREPAAGPAGNQKPQAKLFSLHIARLAHGVSGVHIIYVKIFFGYLVIDFKFLNVRIFQRRL